MRILVVGGTGFIGGETAIRLAALGHEVIVGARKPAPPATAMAKFPLLTGDYIEGGYTTAELSGFDAVIFAAGSDIRHVTPGRSEDEHWHIANAQATPAFFERAKAAGVQRAVLLGSFYPQAAPHLVEKIPYIKARKVADDAVRALASASFNVCSVNPPYVVGAVPGLIIPAYVAYVQYAAGRLPIPRFAPGGGANFISVAAVAEALISAVTKGQTGKAYLVGDENLPFKDYLEMFFRALGDARPLEIRDEAHPLFPDSILYAGRKGTIYYEPDAAENEFLGYRCHDIGNAVRQIVDEYTSFAA